MVASTSAAAAIHKVPSMSSAPTTRRFTSFPALRHRLEFRQGDPVSDLLEDGGDLHANFDGLVRTTDKRRDHLHTLAQVHHRKNDGNLVRKCGMVRPPDDGEGVHGAAARESLPLVLRGEKEWTQDARVVDEPFAAAAALQHEPSLNSAREEWTIPLEQRGGWNPVRQTLLMYGRRVVRNRHVLLSGQRLRHTRGYAAVSIKRCAASRSCPELRSTRRRQRALSPARSVSAIPSRSRSAP